MKILKKQMIYIVISLALLCVIFILTNLNENSTILFSIEVTIIVFYFLCVLFIYKDRFNPFIFLIISFGLGILDVILVALKIRTISNLHPMYIYEKTLGIIILWLLGFAFAFNISFNKKRNISLKINNVINKILNTSNIKVILVIFSIMYIYVIYKIVITIVHIGSIEAAMVNSAIFRYDDQGYLATLLALCAIIPICFLELKQNKIASFSMLIMVIILMLTGRRGLIINSLIIPFVIYYHYRRNKITNKLLIFIGGICVIIILFLGMLRGQSSNANTDNWLINVITDLTITTQLGENLPDTIYAIDIGQVEYQHFEYLNRGLIGLIPRKIWKNKPELIDHSMIVSKLVYDVTEYGRPIGAYGFAYLCFGTIGVILCGLITGILTKKFYVWMIENNSYISIFIYSVLIIYVMNIIKPEALMNIITVFIIVLCSTIISKILKKKEG